jgi:hypothetical protein
MTVMSADEIVQLVLRERQSRDRGWYDQMADCFAEDSVVEMSWFQGSGADFVRATRDMVEPRRLRSAPSQPADGPHRRGPCAGRTTAHHRVAS